MVLKKRNLKTSENFQKEFALKDVVKENLELASIVHKDSYKRKCWNVTVSILKILLLLIITPCFLNFAALVREETELKPDGIFIDVNNGQNIFKRCRGEGKPTVLLDAPLGHTSDVWSLIEQSVAKFTKVCVYDRAGLGYSDRVIKGNNETRKAGKAYTVERMVEDFHRVFENEEKPYVLVGADFGATVMKFYTQIFPDTVASLILINPWYEELFRGDDNPWSAYWFNSNLPSLQLQHIASALGLTRLGLQASLLLSPYNYADVSEIIKNRQKYLKCKPSHISSMVEESYFLNESLAQARVLQKFRPLPADLRLSLIWTEKYAFKFPEEKHRVWLRSQEMILKSLQKEPQLNIKIRGYLPKALFAKSSRIADVILTAVNDARSQRTLKY